MRYWQAIAKEQKTRSINTRGEAPIKSFLYILWIGLVAISCDCLLKDINHSDQPWVPMELPILISCVSSMAAISNAIYESVSNIESRAKSSEKRLTVSNR